MRALLRILVPLRHLVAGFFRHDVVLRREGATVHLELQASPPGARARKGSRQEAAQHKERQEVGLMLEQLAAVLDAVPGTRTTMRHLVRVEQAVERKGLRALHKLPLEVLQHALEQFEGLVTNWSPVGLASLRSKMAVAIIDREHHDPEREAEAYRTAAVLETAPGLGTSLPLPEVVDRSDDEALAAAYAALGDLAPAEVQMMTELSSPSARAVAPADARPPAAAEPLKLRELQG